MIFQQGEICFKIEAEILKGFKIFTDFQQYGFLLSEKSLLRIIYGA